MGEEEATYTTDVLPAVKERLEFFFSDANLRQDKFLHSLVLDGADVPVETLLKFNTIKKHTTDPAIIVQAAKELSTILKVSEDDKSVSRVKPFTMALMDGNLPLTLHVDNLPVKDKAYECTTDEIRGLFSKYGKVNLVKLIFVGKSRKATGSAYVEFAEKAAADAAAEETSIAEGETVAKKPIELKGQTLKILTLQAFREKKRKDRAITKQAEEPEVETFTLDWKPGCVIRLEGLAEECDREAILDAVSQGLDMTGEQLKEEKVVYADYSRGQKDGALRFNEPSDKIKMLFEKLKSGDVRIKDQVVEAVRILEGDEEKAYWDGFIEFKNKQLKLRTERRHSSNKRRKYH